MNKVEALERLTKARNMYQPIIGFPKASKREVLPFHNRILSIAKYCGFTDSYLVGGCANGFDCFELVKYGAKVTGVDNCTGNGCHDCLMIASATSVFLGCKPDNPKFVLAEFPQYFYYTEEKWDWVLLLMLLHNMLKFMGMNEVLRMIDEISQRARKGLIITSRGGINPDHIVRDTKYNRWEEVPCPKRGNKRDIAFGFPIWAFHL